MPREPSRREGGASRPRRTPRGPPRTDVGRKEPGYRWEWKEQEPEWWEEGDTPEDGGSMDDPHHS
jgi:hypothetical protein